MRPSSDLAHNPYGLVDRKLGELFPLVESVSENLAEIQHLSANLEAIHTLAEVYGQTGALGFATATATQIASAADSINTAAKAAGKPVWDTTNNRLMVASGQSATAAWFLCDGSVSVTPA